jgi:hypothetical protein
MNNQLKIALLILLSLCSFSSFSQDLFIYKNGNELTVKVLRINENDIIYKKSSNINGPEYTEEKNNIFMIKYENGTKDIFQKETQAEERNVTRTKETNNCEHKKDSIAFINNKYTIVCKNCNKKIRYASIEEVASNSVNNSNGNTIKLPCGIKPEEPPRFNNPQYKNSPKHKAYYKKLKIWRDCTGN